MDDMTLDLTPGSPEWARRVSPSKAAAILSLSPWESQYAIWRKMRGDVPPDAETEAMERGNLLESGVLAWWRKRHDHGTWAEQVTYTLDDWCVATPDAVTTLDGQHIIVEAKTASDMDAWGDPGTDEIPLHYLAQVYLAAHVANLCGTPVTTIHVPVLGPRLRFSNYVVPYSAEHGGDLLARCRAFYDTLAADTPPPLDSSVATYEAVRKVHPDIDAGAEVIVTEPVGRELLEAVLDLKDAEARERLAKATVIEAMGRAQYAVCNGVRVARRQPNKTGVSFVALPKSLGLLGSGEAS